jgi:polyferredoxin/YHS domain-containing protein
MRRVLTLGGLSLAVCVAAVSVWRSHSSATMSGWLSQVSVDPVCHMEIGHRITHEHGGTTYAFCTERCRALFSQNPGAYLTERCLVCALAGKKTNVDQTVTAAWQDKTYRFCSVDHRSAFQVDPAGFFLHTMWGIPGWLYYSSIGFLLVLSFGLFEWMAPRLSAGSPSKRFNLLKYPSVLALVKHPVTRFVAQGIMAVAFVTIIAAGLFGSQLPSKNIAPILTWTVWWGGLVVIILLAGKAWCYVCPWDAIAGWAEGLKLWGRRKEGLSLGLSWPKVMRNIWPATILFIGLTWVEIGFGVTMKPRATAWLGLGMLGMAFVSAFVFDRKSFCRYGCLVGRVSGLYALFAPVEVRAEDRDVCKSCATHSCYHGNEMGEPCPTHQYLGAMDQNTYCISCMECVKSCELDNVALNIRPWGSDLETHKRPRTDEAYLALLMLSLTAFHGLTMTGIWEEFVRGLSDVLGVGRSVAFSVGMAGLIGLPLAIYALLVGLSMKMSGEAEVKYKDYFVRYAYALLPIALFYHLAHNSEHLLMEGQKVVALASDPMGWGWNLMGTGLLTIAPLASLSTLWGMQVLLVLVGHVYSLWVARRTAVGLFGEGGSAFRSQLPMLAAMVLFSLLSLWLLKQPMVMRTSAM